MFDKPCFHRLVGTRQDQNGQGNHDRAQQDFPRLAGLQELGSRAADGATL